MRAAGFGAAARHSLEWLVFGALPAAVFCWWLGFAVLETREDSVIYWGFDTLQYWQGAKDVLAGVSPYPVPADLAGAGDHLNSAELLEMFRFSYPAAAAVAFIPLGLLGFDVAAALWGVLLIVSLFASVRILDVRDWRVMGVVLGSAPAIDAVRIGTLTPIMLLLLAIAWRWRDRLWAVSAALAAALAFKLFLLPMVIWLAATRRWLAAILTIGLAAVANLVAWAAIGFDGFADYPTYLRELTEIVEIRGYSLVALGVKAGLPEALAEVLPFVVGLPILASAVLIARREDGDRRAFSIVVVGSIALTPIVWNHYFLLLVAPLALARPKLAWAWGLMWAFWIIPTPGNSGEFWRIAVAVAICAAALKVLSSNADRPRPITTS